MQRSMLASLLGLLTCGLVTGAVGAAAVPPEQTAPPPPGIPAATDVVLDPATTAVLVVDLSTRCSNPRQICREIVPAVGRFLDVARARGVFVLYTVSASAQGTPLGDAWEGFNRRADEPIVYPDAFDKFVGGELQGLLAPRGITTLVVAGSSTNVSVLYTSSSAARLYDYQVVIPLDGVNAETDYMQEYALYQLTVLPTVAGNFRFTTFARLSFAGP